MKHEALTIWNAEDFSSPEKLAALRVGDEVAFNLKNGKEAAFVVADITDGILTGCLFKGVRDMAMYDGRRWWNTDYVNYPESDARERLNEEFLSLLPDELATLLVARTIIQTVDREVYACTDKLMLKQMLGADAVGHYSLASTVSVSWAFLLSAVIDSLYPEIVQSFRKDRLRYERKNRQLYAIVIYASLFVSALICLIAKPFVVTLYGEKYLAAVMPLRIVVWYTAFSYLGVARNAWMVCENQQKYLKYLYISAAALNVVLNLALIPLWGASGAAAASLITQASTTILLPALIRPLRPNAKLMLDAVLLRGVLPGKARER